MSKVWKSSCKRPAIKHAFMPRGFEECISILGCIAPRGTLVARDKNYSAREIWENYLRVSENVERIRRYSKSYLCYSVRKYSFDYLVLYRVKIIWLGKRKLVSVEDSWFSLDKKQGRCMKPSIFYSEKNVAGEFSWPTVMDGYSRLTSRTLPRGYLWCQRSPGGGATNPYPPFETTSPTYFYDVHIFWRFS